MRIGAGCLLAAGLTAQAQTLPAEAEYRNSGRKFFVVYRGELRNLNDANPPEVAEADTAETARAIADRLNAGLRGNDAFRYNYDWKTRGASDASTASRETSPLVIGAPAPRASGYTVPPAPHSGTPTPAPVTDPIVGTWQYENERFRTVNRLSADGSGTVSTFDKLSGQNLPRVVFRWRRRGAKVYWGGETEGWTEFNAGGRLGQVSD
jgi:hypothetical protein